MNTKPFYLTLSLLLFLLHTSFAMANTMQNDDGEFVVVLDAGHGGHDPGNLGNGYLEKNIALNIVLKVGSILEQNRNIKVIYTRKDDTFVDLFVRGEIANKANADLFVSVHCDSHSSDAHGAGTFVLGLHANKQNFEIAKKENQVIYLEDNYESRYANYDINSPESVIGLTIMQEEFLDQSIALAKTIQDNFANKLKRKNRQVKQAGFIVLHQTFMPSVLVETGFLTNDNEGAYLNSNKGQQEMGTAIAESILAYKNNVAQTNIGSSLPTSRPTPNPNEIKSTPELDDVEREVAAVEKKVAEKLPAEKPKVEKPKVEKPDVEKQIVEKTTEAVKEADKPEIIEPEVIVEDVVEAAKPAINEVVVEKAPEVKEIIEKKEEVKTPVVTETPKPKNANIIFKVQLMATVKVIPLVSSEFKGLTSISKEPVRNLYRYMHGNTNSYDEAVRLKINAINAGYADAYIVAYKDGSRISAKEARKMVLQ